MPSHRQVHSHQVAAVAQGVQVVSSSTDFCEVVEHGGSSDERSTGRTHRAPPPLQLGRSRLAGPVQSRGHSVHGSGAPWRISRCGTRPRSAAAPRTDQPPGVCVNAGASNPECRSRRPVPDYAHPAARPHSRRSAAGHSGGNIAPTINIGLALHLIQGPLESRRIVDSTELTQDEVDILLAITHRPLTTRRDRNGRAHGATPWRCSAHS